ncbi:MAG: DMT family transporter [Phaeodactylibacter sp.]|nr:DMT family transporter [Phaeodactylibacter sp.]MCB9299672.1 DMT family transporter [Lewinellaceae bacterium]
MSAGWKSWGVLILLSLIWGTSYILIKKGLQAFSPTQVACLRLSVASLAFLPILLHRFARIDWSRWKALLLVGLLGFGIPAFLFAVAQTQISSSMAGILNSLTPLFTLLLGILLFGLRASWAKGLGVLVGLIGAALLILLGNGDGSGGNPWYGVLVVLGAICYAASSNVVGAQLRDMSSITISAAAFAMIGLPAIGYLFSTDFLSVMAHEAGAWRAFGAVVLLALLSTVLASVIFFRLVQWTSPVFASMISYLVPLVAVAWGLFDGESISLVHFLGMALILSGIYLVKK